MNYGFTITTTVETLLSYCRYSVATTVTPGVLHPGGTDPAAVGTDPRAVQSPIGTILTCLRQVTRRDPCTVVSVPVETPVTPPIHHVFVNRQGKIQAWLNLMNSAKF
jgi:acyl CoA:acetate/3-ketoacid CoA transferase